ncbi:MAG: AraC family transcriptional regulator [Chthoniobacterales bacterium]
MSRLRKYSSPDPFSVSRMRLTGDPKAYLFGQAVYPLKGCFRRTLQEDFQLIVVLSGTVRVKTGRTRYELKPGDGILQQPGHREVYEFSETEETSHTWCQVSPHVLSTKDKQLLKRAVGVYKIPAAVHLLIEEGLAVEDHTHEAMHSAMQALARACLLRFVSHACLMEKTKNDIPLHPVLERALEIVASDFAQLHSAEDLAKRVGISTIQLRALFLQAKMESASAMIWRLKTEHAIQLLRSTSLTLGEIADYCGYANAFHLSRSVKRRTSYSPRELRNREWNKDSRK